MVVIESETHPAIPSIPLLRPLSDLFIPLCFAIMNPLTHQVSPIPFTLDKRNMHTVVVCQRFSRRVGHREWCNNDCRFLLADVTTACRVVQLQVTRARACTPTRALTNEGMHIDIHGPLSFSQRYHLLDFKYYHWLHD